MYHALNKILRMGSLSGYIIDLVQLFSYPGSDFDSAFMAMSFLFFLINNFCGAKANIECSLYYRFLELAFLVYEIIEIKCLDIESWVVFVWLFLLLCKY